MGGRAVKKTDGQVDGRGRARYAGLAAPALHILAEGVFRKLKEKT